MVLNSVNGLTPVTVIALGAGSPPVAGGGGGATGPDPKPPSMARISGGTSFIAVTMAAGSMVASAVSFDPAALILTVLARSLMDCLVSLLMLTIASGILAIASTSLADFSSLKTANALTW